MKRILYSIILFFCVSSLLWAAGDGYASQSVLSSGKWAKIRVDKTGMYKLTQSDLKRMGFSDINKVAVYGYGGWLMSENFSEQPIDDLPELPLWKGKGFLLFYAKGPVKWEYDEQQGFVHTNNPYSNYGYYFVTEKAETPREMKLAEEVEGAALQVGAFDDYLLWEKDQVSVNSSGRELYGEDFTYTLSRDFPVTVSGITDDQGTVTLDFISRIPAGKRGLVRLNINDQEILSISRSTGSSVDSYVKAIRLFGQKDWIGNKSENFKVNIQYNTTGHENVHLNYFVLQMKRVLRLYDGHTLFRSVAARGNASCFTLSNVNDNTLVFDVTDGEDVQLVPVDLSGQQLTFTLPAKEEIHEFVAVNPDKALIPEFERNVENQNLHALPQQDMIILAAPAMALEAERLAEMHREKDGLSVKVLSPEQVYNEFSSGTPDVSAYRRLMKMFYDRKTSEIDAPKYLLLFGDGSYDNRGLTAVWRNVDRSNMLLTYQTENSLDAASHVVDDYFGFLRTEDDNKPLDERMLNVGIGRFPVRTVEEARKAVDKVITYVNNAEIGPWKNNLCFMADDGSNADRFTQNHMLQSDTLAQYLEKKHPEFLINKLYFDAYKKVLSGGQESYPEVTAAYKKLLKDGLLYVNYVGHGNVTSWSDERVWSHSDIVSSTYKRLPVWVTATCDFTRFDDVTTTAGEDVFLNPVSGGIALFTTTRVAYSSYNSRLNSSLLRHLFEKQNGRRLTLGEVMKNTKNALSGYYKLGFSLIGDPAIKMVYPEYRMEVTSINGRSATEDTLNFRAMDKITVEGRIVHPDGKTAVDFNGQVFPTIKDSKVTVKCLDNNHMGYEPFIFTDYPYTLYTGNDSVRSGRFSFSFTVPKDISYSGRQGKMNLYAVDAVSGNEAQGNYDRFIVGGSSVIEQKDTVGPEVRLLYLNDTTFVEGGKVNTTPYMVVRLWDQSGVNISGSGLGHDLMLTIDNSPYMIYNLNSYYQILVGSEGEGLLQFSIPKLEPGKHTAELEVWDILNNSTRYSFTFEVIEGLKPVVVDVKATPVPAREQVTFHISHNRPESRMNVNVMVYDLAGRLLWKHKESGSSELFKSYDVTWDLNASNGSRLRPGVYLYRCAISTDASKEASEAKKMIVLGPR